MPTILAAIVLLLLTGLGTASSPSILSASPERAWFSGIAVFVLVLLFGASAPGLQSHTAERPATTLGRSEPHYLRRWSAPIACWAAALIAQFIAPFTLTPFLLWGISILSVGAIALPAMLAAQKKITPAEVGGLLAVLGLGVYFRFWNLPAMPFNYDGDVASVGLSAKDLLSGADNAWLGVRWGSISIPCLRLWALGMASFGADLRGLALTMTAVGSLGILAVWFLVRTSSGRRAGLIAAFFCAASLAHIHFSRTLYIEPASIVLCLEIGLLISWFKLRRLELLILSGCVGGLGLVVYDSARVGLLLVPLFLCAAALARELEWKTAVLGLGYFVAGVVLGWGPNLAIALSNLEDFVGRANSVTIFSADAQTHLMGAYETKSFYYMLSEQVRRSFLGALYLQDTSPHAGYPLPQLELLTRWLMLLGFGAALVHSAQPLRLLLVLWVVLVNFFGGVLTLDPPYWPHLAAALPAYFLFAAEGAQLLLAAQPRRARRYLLVGLLLAGAWHAISTWHQYVQLAASRADGFSRSWRYLETLPAASKVLLVGDEFSWEDRRYQFFAQHIRGRSCTLRELESITLFKDELLLVSPPNADRVQALLFERGIPASRKTWSAPPANGELIILKLATQLEGRGGNTDQIGDARNSSIP